MTLAMDFLRDLFLFSFVFLASILLTGYSLLPPKSLCSLGPVPGVLQLGITLVPLSLHIVNTGPIYSGTSPRGPTIEHNTSTTLSSHQYYRLHIYWD